MAGGGVASSDDHDYAVFHSSEGVRAYDQTAPEENNEGDRFAVRAGRFLYGCGAFFALKIQTAKSAKQMEEFAKEIGNLEKLRGHASIVQIRDHASLPRTRHVAILMELAACDLATFFQRSGYSCGVSEMLSIWRSLVDAVGAAHTQEIIHRDLKPQNFLLVPIAPPFADRILATTPVPSENFEFRIVNRVTTNDSEKMGDVELILRDSVTGISQVLQLIIKVSDFGLAQPLDLEENASHLSVQDHAGTIKYMAPEAFEASEDGVQRLSKRVDIWALGVMLFQMLHRGRTPFDSYCWPGKPIRAAVAIASKDVHAKVMIFDRQGVWATEKKSLQRNDPHALGSAGSEGDTAASVCQSSTVMSLLSTEFLFRVCENCLAFEASDRVLAGDLKMWVEHLLDSKWWEETIRSLPDGAVQDLLSSVSMEDDEVETASQLDKLNLVRQGGDRIEQVFFRELRRATSPPGNKYSSGNCDVPRLNKYSCGNCATASANIVAPPATGESVEEREQRDNGEELRVVALPARGEAVEEWEQADEQGTQLDIVGLPARGEAVEKCEEGEDKEKLQATQQLLPHCINEENSESGRQERASVERPGERWFAPPQSGFCGFNIKNIGIIGIIASLILAVGVCIFVVLKLTPVSAQESSVSIPVPPTTPTFLAPTIPSPTAPVLVGPTIASPAPKVLAPTNPPASPASPPAASPRPASSPFLASPASASSLRPASRGAPPESVSREDRTASGRPRVPEAPTLEVSDRDDVAVAPRALERRLNGAPAPSASTQTEEEDSSSVCVDALTAEPESVEPESPVCTRKRTLSDASTTCPSAPDRRSGVSSASQSPMRRRPGNDLGLEARAGGSDPPSSILDDLIECLWQGSSDDDDKNYSECVWEAKRGLIELAKADEKFEDVPAMKRSDGGQPPQVRGFVLNVSTFVHTCYRGAASTLATSPVTSVDEGGAAYKFSSKGILVFSAF